MPDPDVMTEIAKAMMAQQIQPAGRYAGGQYVPPGFDQMVRPIAPFGFGQPPDRNTYDPADVASQRQRQLMQEQI